MKPTSMAALAALFASLLAGLPAWGAQPAGAVAAPTPASASTASQLAPVEADAIDAGAVKEPYVKRTVIDGKTTRIEELRVRGQLKKVTVTSKGGAPAYEIITDAGSRDLLPGPTNSLGASGQRVWNVLHF